MSLNNFSIASANYENVIYDFKITSITGDKIDLSKFKGKTILIVNVASKCGFTKQYKSLQELQNQYEAKGFQVLGFPCNDFGGQEPGTLEEIKEFCSINYQVSFPLFAKVHAMGETTEPYTTLNQVEPSGDVTWNFEKFLINKECNVIKRFKSAVEPSDTKLKEAIEQELSR